MATASARDAITGRKSAIPAAATKSANLRGEEPVHGSDLRTPIPLPVDLLGDEVQELGEPQDLPVHAARQVRRLLEARALVLADELDALGEPRHGRVRGLPLLRLGLCSGGVVTSGPLGEPQDR